MPLENKYGSIGTFGIRPVETMKTLLIILGIVVLCAFGSETAATHLRAADIIVRKADCVSLRYLITIRVYTNTLSNTPVGGTTLDDGHVSFGDGRVVIIPHTQLTLRPDLGLNVAVAMIELEHTYARDGEYRINYYERDRSRGVINIPNAEDVAYSTYIQIKATAASCNSFPLLTVAPLDRGCRGVTFFHHPGATDSDGDSLSYAITIPSRSSSAFVDGFLQPADPRFYTNFNEGNESRDAPASFTINEVTGLIKWDAPGTIGEYNIAFKILEWRRDPDTGQFFLMSETIRDMQIVVEDCINQRPRLNVPGTVCIEAGKLLSATITGSDPDNHPVKIEVFSSIIEGGPETRPATYAPVMSEFFPSEPPVKLSFEWQTDCIHARDQHYQVVFKITDNPPSGPKLVTFHTWNIRVIAPPPRWVSVTPGLSDRTAHLKWSGYSCPNAEKIQVWRKVGSTPFTPGECVAGLSQYKGYQLIAELSAMSTSYHDTNGGQNLAVGAQYCYRLVALFPGTAGGKSYVSSELCMEPILADAPVITHVTVSDTKKLSGVINVRWLPPFDLSSEQYPPPYEYEIHRADGYSGEENITDISGRLKDLETLSFDDAGANTLEEIYNYRIVLYSRTRDDGQYIAIDTSAVASTVRLEAEPAKNRITLSWNSVVPWSNVAADPWHYIYRGSPDDPEQQLALIDSVDVSENGFEYVDVGKFSGIQLKDNEMYSYAVVTKGTYGNGAIPILLNRSQRITLYPENNLVPCTPVLNVDQSDCDKFAQGSCGYTDFFNTLHWLPDDTGGCRKDIVAYNIFSSSGDADAGYTLLTNTSDDHFRDEDLLSFARCYRVQAIDSRGSTSELSVPACNDNCPAFILPNVFTPNGDGCNDLFTAFGAHILENAGCAAALPQICPAFVKSVSLKVMNRWGRVVYEYSSGQNGSITIDWDGRGKNGAVLESGLYFYIADVNFEAIEIRKRKQLLKGWVHILY
jgi:hypothetical protein